MNIELAAGFERALRESDTTLILNKCAYQETSSGNVRNPDFYYIWDKETKILKVSIHIKEADYSADNITVYFRRKHRTETEIEIGTEEVAFNIKNNNNNPNKLIDLDLSNFCENGIIANIQSSLPAELKIVEDYNLDIGSSIFLVDKEDNKNLIIKNSFAKLLLITNNDEIPNDLDYGKTVLNSNGEVISRKYNYRRYKKDSFDFKLLNSGYVSSKNGIDCYNVGNSKTKLKVSGTIGYTDVLIENNKILKEVDGFQNISEIPDLVIYKKQENSTNIWEGKVTVDRSKNIIVPENKLEIPRKEVLIVSANFVDYDNSIISVSKEIIINQEDDYNELKPWQIEYENLENIRIEYDNTTTSTLPVLIFQEPRQWEDGSDHSLSTRVLLKCHSEMLDLLKEKEIKLSYEYFSEEDSNKDKEAEQVFTEFFKVEKTDLNKEDNSEPNDTISIDITANHILREGVTLQNNIWYPYVSNKPVVIKLIISVDLEGFMGFYDYSTELIVIRQPEDIHKFGSISISPGITNWAIQKSSKNTDISDGSCEFYFNIDNSILTTNENGEDIYVKYCGWFFDKINPIINIKNTDFFLTNDHNQFEKTNNDIKSIGLLKFRDKNYENYLYSNILSLVNSSAVMDHLGYITINGINPNYFKQNSDTCFRDIYNRLISNNLVNSWRTKVFTTSIKLPIQLIKKGIINYQSFDGNEVTDGEVTYTASGPNSEIPNPGNLLNYIVLKVNEVFPIKFTSIGKNINLYDLNTKQKIITNKYYTGTKDYKLSIKYITTETVSSSNSINFSINGTNHSIKLVSASPTTNKGTDDVEIKYSKKCLCVSKRTDGIYGRDGVLCISDGSIFAKSNSDICLAQSDNDNCSLGSIFDFEEYKKGNKKIYLKSNFSEGDYKEHVIKFTTFESLSDDEYSIINNDTKDRFGSIPFDVFTKFNEKCPIIKEPYYISSLSSTGLQNNQPDRTLGQVYYSHLLNFTEPEFYDKLGYQLGSTMTILSFDRPEGYTYDNNGIELYNRIYLQSNYPLSEGELDLNLGSLGDNIKWESSEHNFTIEEKNINIETSDHISVNNTYPNGTVDYYLTPRLIQKEDYKTNESKNILTHLGIELNNNTITGEATITNNICSNNIFSGFSVKSNDQKDNSNKLLDIINPATTKINVIPCGDINSDKGEYVVYKNKKYYLQENSSVVLDAIEGEEKRLEFDLYKWYQSTVENINCFGSVVINRSTQTSSFSGIYYNEESVKIYHNRFHIDGIGGNYDSIVPVKTSFLDNEISFGGLLSGITKVPIRIELKHKIYDDITERSTVFDIQNTNNSCHLYIADELLSTNYISSHLYQTTYDLTFSLKNNFLKSRNQDPFSYSKKLQIPWKGIENAFIVYTYDRINNVYQTPKIIFSKKGCTELNLSNCGWDDTNIFFKIFPISLILNEEGTSDLSSMYYSNNLLKIKLHENLSYYESQLQSIKSDLGDYATVTSNLPIEISHDQYYSVLDLCFDINLNFPQNLSNNTITKEFSINLGDGNIIPIKINQYGFSGDSGRLVNLKTGNDILIHSSGFCINDINNIGTFKLKTKTNNIIDYTNQSIYLKLNDVFITNTVNIEENIDENNVIDEEYPYLITVTADFPTRYAKGDNSESSLIGNLTVSDSNGIIISPRINCYQGYIYPMLINSTTGQDYTVDLVNSTYTGSVGTETEPLEYINGIGPDFKIVFYQRELFFDSLLNSFGVNLSDIEERVTTGERIPSNAQYSAVTSKSIWELLGNSKYHVNKYNTDLIYTNDEYPILRHNIILESGSNYDISENDLIKVKTTLQIGNHKLTATSNISNNSVAGSDLITNSPITFDFWIKIIN